MLKEKLQSIHAALGEALGNAATDSDADLLRLCRHNLLAAAEMAEAMEHGLTVAARENGNTLENFRMEDFIPTRDFQTTFKEVV